MKTWIGRTTLGLLITLLLSPIPSAAADLMDPQRCEPFEHNQTYRPNRGFFRAPAWFFETAVAITYRAERCISIDPVTRSSTTTLVGTAHVTRRADGADLGTFPFRSVELRTRTTEEASWWTCDAPSVDYRWVIEGVYRFRVAAARGTWSYTQAALTRDVTRARASFDACTI